MKITLVAGARPNFMKIAPIIHAIQKARMEGKQIGYRLVHTGQHYDHKMSKTFFEELNIPAPDTNLNCGGGSQAEQTAAIMIAFEKELQEHPTDLVIVVGDVTSTMACAITAKKEGVKVAHVEAGIRSFDLTMPEEINRMVTDSITDYFFITSETAHQNLSNAGIPGDRIFFVGNVMIDTLLVNVDKFRKPAFFDEMDLIEGRYLVMTLHRPANVDEAGQLSAMLREISRHSGNFPIVFPIHPRTRRVFNQLGIDLANIQVVEPMGYLEFNYLVKHSGGVITDSGGITEETTVMGIPCITLRDNTERPETITTGTNELVGTDPGKLGPYLEKMVKGQWKKGSIPEKWDGKASERIVKQLLVIGRRL